MDMNIVVRPGKRAPRLPNISRDAFIAYMLQYKSFSRDEVIEYADEVEAEWGKHDAWTLMDRLEDYAIDCRRFIENKA